MSLIRHISPGVRYGREVSLGFKAKLPLTDAKLPCPLSDRYAFISAT
jgi:hypothetical protein